MPDKSSFIRNLDIYEGLTDEEIVCIAKHSRDEHVKRNMQVYSPHSDDQNIYVIKKGEVQLYHHKNGKKIVFDILTPGTVFGCFDPKEKRHSHFAECTRDSYLCITPVNEFSMLVSQRPEMMLRFMQRISSRLKDYENKLEASSGSAADKIMYEISRLKAKRSKNFFGKYLPIPLRITHEEIANLTGLNRVTVTRTLSELKKQKLISIDENTGIIEINLSN